VSCPLLNSQSLQPLRNVSTVRPHRDLRVNREDTPVATDEERPAPRKSTRADDAVRPRRRHRGIAQNRIVDSQRGGKLRVHVRPVDTGGEIRNIEPRQEVARRVPRLPRAARTERPALRGSSGSERFRKPGEHDRNGTAVRGLPRRCRDIVRQPIRPPVGSQK